MVKHKADALATLGYTAIALDMYGKGVQGKSKEENSKLMSPFMENRARLRSRILAGWEAVQNLPFVDRSRMGAIGFCFGGLCALDLAWSGVDIKAVVSFHGHDDPMAGSEQVLAFEHEMTESKVDWQMHLFSNTVHAFTNPEAHDPAFGTVYEAKADFRSWKGMKNFFEEVLDP